jgi:tetratricopeptide (TPR) repeat protein
VRLDPGFVSAYARLGDIFMSLRREREGLVAWQRAVELANSRQLTTREALRLRAQYLAETATLAETEEASRAYALHYPMDFDANIYLGSLIAQQGRTEESIPWLENAARLRPAAPSGHLFLAYRLIELERLDEAAVVSDRLRQSTQPEWALWLTALISFTRGDLPTALERLEGLRGTTDRVWRSRFHALHSSWLAEAGRFEDAEQGLVEGIEFDAANGLRDRAALKWLYVAQLRARADDRVASTEAVKKALSASNDVRTLALAGSQLAQLGIIEEAQAMRDALAREAPIPRVRIALHRIDAHLELARAHPDLAVQTLAEIETIVPFMESKVFYASALTAAGRGSEAIAVLSDWIRHPARFYAGPEPPSPGPWAAAVEDYIRLVSRQGSDHELAAWQARLLAFRGGQTAIPGR